MTHKGTIKTGVTCALLSALIAAASNGFGHPAPGDVSSGTTIEIPADTTAPLVSIGHPPFRLLDADGASVLHSGNPVSTNMTCGQGCHDVTYIETHNYHAQVGFDEIVGPGRVPGGRPWDVGPGLFGRWDPFSYPTFIPPNVDQFDGVIGEWIREFGWRHIGGGPALADTIGAEINCFLCHSPHPDNEARIRELNEGRFEWVVTATLANSGLVRRTKDGWAYDNALFDDTGTVPAGRIDLVPPSSENCGMCHGLVHTGVDPVWPTLGLREWGTETKGQIFSPQKMFRSAMNLTDKESLTRPWDIHAERLMRCANCHHLLNEPAFAAEAFATRPSHLNVDTRRQGIGEYLRRPLHQLVKGHSASGTVAARLNGSMRRCEGCHNFDAAHDWLPYKRRHAERLLCESCHIPKVYSPARRVTDWTVLTPEGGPRVEYRGVVGPVEDPASLVVGSRPVLLPRITRDDPLARLAPHNLIASWYWIHGDPPRPVRPDDLKKAYFEENVYHPEIVLAFDADGDGNIAEKELILDSDGKLNTVQRRLAAIDLEDPRIVGEIQPLSLHHGVAAAGWVTRACDVCHSRSSVITSPVEIASAAPGGVVPVTVGDTNARMGGELGVDDTGRLLYRPVTRVDGFYVLGHDRWRAIDAGGLFVILAVLVAAVVHGGFRFHLSRSRGGGA